MRCGENLAQKRFGLMGCLTVRSRRTLGLAMACGIAVAASTSGTQDAIANGDTRTLTIQHMHTKEVLTITFKRWGSYDYAALEKLNWHLRDWRRDEPKRMNPRLFDLLWEVHRESGASGPVNVVSAYRSPETNAMLRRRSRAVAKSSQHMQGNAVDFYVPGMHMSQMREIAMRLQRGGVGYYPTANTPFVHLDVGSVRSWPRMGRDQLARLFPDGKTVHLPAGGGTMPGYDLAYAEILARGGSVGRWRRRERRIGWRWRWLLCAAVWRRPRGGGGGTVVSRWPWRLAVMTRVCALSSSAAALQRRQKRPVRHQAFAAA